MSESMQVRLKRRRSPWIALILILIFAGVVFQWCWPSAADPVAQLQTATVTRGDIESVVTAVGVLQPSRYVDLGAQVSGQIKALHVEVGDAVRSGQLLAEIDPRVYLAKVEEAQATLANLRAQLKIKQAQRTLSAKQLTRHQELLRQDSVAVSAVEIAEAAFTTAEAEMEAIAAQIGQAEAALATAQVNLGYTRIVAPMAGTVVALAAREGQTLNANQQTPLLLRLADMERMTVWTQVAEADVLRLEQDQEAYFTVLGELGRRWTGRLRQVLPTPELVNNVVFYNAVFDVPNPERQLRVQMTAQVFFVLARAEQVLLAPASALASAREGKGHRRAGSGNRKGNGQGNGNRERRSVVQVLRADGSVEARPVEVGVRTPVQVEIVSGLQEGEVVIAGTAPPAKGTKKGGLATGGGKL